MPELSRFYGIIIYLFAKDHAPPHCHVKYGDDRALVSLETGELLEGNLPRRALRLVQDWIELHKAELFADWEEAQTERPQIKKIAPLE